jgi:AraC family transcriptional regulator
MDSVSSMNNALTYKNHLAKDIDYCEIAKIAYCSEYHFKRMFI